MAPSISRLSADILLGLTTHEPLVSLFYAIGLLAIVASLSLVPVKSASSNLTFFLIANELFFNFAGELFPYFELDVSPFAVCCLDFAMLILVSLFPVSAMASSLSFFRS